MADLSKVYSQVGWFTSYGENLAKWRQQSNKSKIISDFETKKFSDEINEILREALNTGELNVHRKPTFRAVPYSLYPLNTNDVIRWTDVKRVIESAINQKLPDEPIFMTWWPEMAKTVAIDDTSSKDDNFPYTLSFSAQFGDKCIATSCKFDNINILKKALTKDVFYSYLLENGFYSFETYLRESQNKHLDSVVFLVDMAVRKPFKGFHPTCPSFEEMIVSSPIWSKTHGQYFQNTPKKALSVGGLVRLLDNDYSIDNFIVWLKSQGVDVPVDLFSFADTVKNWQQVQPEPIADSDITSNQTKSARRKKTATDWYENLKPNTTIQELSNADIVEAIIKFSPHDKPDWQQGGLDWINRNGNKIWKKKESGKKPKPHPPRTS